MTNVWKGALLGAANVFAVAVAVALVIANRPRDQAEAFVCVSFFGIVPGVLAGAVLGHIGGKLPAFRWVVLPAFAVLAVALLGAVTAPELIAPAIPPTLGFAVLLERWTHPDREHGELDSIWKGVLLGVANVFVVAALAWLSRSGAGGNSHAPAFHLATFVALFGLVPGAVTGAFVGWVAGVAPWPPVARFVVLAVPAIVVVALLGVLLGHAGLVLYAAVPTCVAAAILERTTRERAPIPTAYARV